MRCSDCRFWNGPSDHRLDLGLEGSGECRRWAPRPRLTVELEAAAVPLLGPERARDLKWHDLTTCWPNTFGDQFCGEHEPVTFGPDGNAPGDA